MKKHSLFLLSLGLLSLCNFFVAVAAEEKEIGELDIAVSKVREQLLDSDEEEDIAVEYSVEGAINGKMHLSFHNDGGFTVTSDSMSDHVVVGCPIVNKIYLVKYKSCGCKAKVIGVSYEQALFFYASLKVVKDYQRDLMK